MADVIQLSDGSVHTIFDERDALELIDQRMGMEMRRWIEDWMSEAEGLRAHHKEVMQSLRQQSETIAGLIREKEIDRKALSTAAGIIGCTTWREMR